jgi:hypothetical protein
MWDVEDRKPVESSFVAVGTAYCRVEDSMVKMCVSFRI